LRKQLLATARRQSVEISTLISSAFIVLILLAPSSVLLAPIYAYPSVCHLSNVAYHYPNEVSPSEQFAVSAYVSAICPQANNYHFSARFDVTNGLNQVLAINYIEDGFIPNNGTPFAVTVANELTAPSSPGAWPIQFIVYTFLSLDAANGLDNEVRTSATIQVGQLNLTAPSNYTNSSMTTAISPAISTTGVANVSLQMPQPASTAAPNNMPYAIVAAVGVIALTAISTVIVIMRKRKART
jgi:hypothetical protein